MDPILRLQYLDAMGITQYVARTPLPGARPSLLLAATQTLTPANIENHQQTQSFTTETPEILSTTRTYHPAPEIEQQVASSTPVTHQAIGFNAPSRQPFMCQIAYWHINDLLILAEMPRMDNATIALLNDILFAIQRNKLPAPELFQWPTGKTNDTSLISAKDYFQGLLDEGLLKKEGLRQILLFGLAPLQLLGQYNDETQEHRYHDWPMIALPDLRHMLEQPTSKADTWKKLLPLVPVA